MQNPLKKHTDTSEEYKPLYGPVATIFGSTNTGSWRIFRPSVNHSECIRCGICEVNCPPNVIEINPELEICVQINWNYCKGCAICANVCPKNCIDMIEEKGGE